MGDNFSLRAVVHAAAAMLPVMTVAMTAAAAAREHRVGDLLLLGRERRVERFRRRDHLAQARRALLHALLLAFQAVDRAHLRRTLGAGLALGDALLDALIHGAGVLAQHVREAVPLRFLRIGDLERRMDVREARFDALARQAEAPLLGRTALPFIWMAQAPHCAVSQPMWVPVRRR